MRDKIERLVAAMAAAQARAQIAEAKADLALEMITYTVTIDEQEKADFGSLFSETVKKKDTDKDLAAAIAFESLGIFLQRFLDEKSRNIHGIKSNMKQWQEELIKSIHQDLERRLL